MPLTDFTADPPTIHIGEPYRRQYLNLLVPGKVTGKGETKNYTYELGELQEFTLHLMHLVNVPFDPCDRVTVDKTKLDDFTVAEKHLLYPFAFLLACLSGNAFDEAIEQYIPAAYRIIRSNQWDMDAVRKMIATANEKLM